jgi:RNA polymerase sigma-70 factor (ECF subfamily)
MSAPPERTEGTASPLTNAFLGALPEPVRLAWARPADLELRLERFHERAAAHWPSLALEPSVFLADVARRIPLGCDPTASLGQLQWEDLYLVCACLRGEARALARFRWKYAAGIRSTIRGQGVPPSEVEDVEQVVFERLLVPSPDQTPRLDQYRGQSALGRWLQIVAVRVTLNHVRRKRVETLATADWQLEVACPAEDQELRHLRQRYQAEFESAFAAALASLSARERNLLRYQHLDGLTGEELAALYGVHRSTTARWIARARSRVLRRTERLLADRLRMSDASVQSVLNLVGCRVTLSLSRLLGLEADE